MKAKKPKGFILENVEGLVNHDKEDPKDPIGRTLQTILNTLDELHYKVSWKVLNAKDFGVPQERKRIYIVGTRKKKPSLDDFPVVNSSLNDILEHGLETKTSPFIEAVLRNFTVDQLRGKSFKDKRGGSDNIHSWDIEMKGPVSNEEKILLGKILTERRKKIYAVEYGIDWMDGMPLTYKHIKALFPNMQNLKNTLESLVKRGYLVKEYPKKKVGNVREQDPNLPIGYNIVAGKMSFEINKVLDPEGTAPTLVAMDMNGLFVVDGAGLRQLSLREGLRLFGYPDDYRFDVDVNLGYDLLGNTVVVPVIKAVALRTLNKIL